jgi:polar amino acid transport system substrate-binding protein
MIRFLGRATWLGLAAVAAALVLGRGVAAAQALTLHYMERSPYSVTAADGSVSGLTATPAALALVQARVPFAWARTPGQRQLALIQEGSGLHCGLGWFRNTERSAHGKFSKALYRDQPFGALARGDSALRAGAPAIDAMALAGETLLVKEGYSYGPALDPLIAQRRSPTLYTSVETVQMVRMLLAGRATWMIVTPEEAQALLDEAGAPATALRVAAFSDMPPGETRHLYCNRAVPDAWLAAIDRALPPLRR